MYRLCLFLTLSLICTWYSALSRCHFNHHRTMLKARTAYSLVNSIPAAALTCEFSSFLLAVYYALPPVKLRLYGRIQMRTLLILILRLRGGARSIVMSLSVCLSACIARKPHRRTSTISVHVVCGRGLVLLWRRCDTLCTSGFVDDVMFSYYGATRSESNTTLFGRSSPDGGTLPVGRQITTMFGRVHQNAAPGRSLLSTRLRLTCCYCCWYYN